MIEFSLRNRQRDRLINLPALRRLIRSLLADVFHAEAAQLCVHLVGAEEMARVNRHYLNHEGSTDVITFDHSDGGPDGEIFGELFISIADAVKQGREFEEPWQSELARYVIHGLLHLRGYDDLEPADRKTMKKEENRLLRHVAARRDLLKLEKKDSLAP